MKKYLYIFIFIFITLPVRAFTYNVMEINNLTFKFYLKKLGLLQYYNIVIIYILKYFENAS